MHRMTALDFESSMGVRVERVHSQTLMGHPGMIIDLEALTLGELAHLQRALIAKQTGGDIVGSACCGCHLPFATWDRARYAVIEPGMGHHHRWCTTCWNQNHPDRRVPPDPALPVIE